MISECGRVARIEEGYVFVETVGNSACARCSAGTGCGGVLMGRVLGDRLHVVRALDGGVGDLMPGDPVSIGLCESALMRGAALIYLVPLAGLFAGMFAGRALGGSSDAVAVLGACAGGLLGGLVTRVLARRVEHDGRYHPVVLGRERIR